MNKKLLILLILVIGAVIGFSGLWKQIPYVSDAIWASGITDTLYTQVQKPLEDTIRNNPLQVVGVAATSSGVLLGTVKKAFDSLKQRRAELSQLRTDASEQLNSITSQFNKVSDEVEVLTKEKQQLETQVTELTNQLQEQAEQYADINAVIAAKDKKIEDLVKQQENFHDIIQRLKLGDGEAIVKTVVA